jgi:glutathione reductase (NADPH)
MSFWNLIQLPDRILFVGGGYISFEFAHIAARAGAAVTILHEDKWPLGQFDQDLVLRLIEHSRRIGIKVELCSEVTSVEGAADGSVAVQVKGGGRFTAGLAVHGSGRVPNVDDLELALGKVDAEKGRLKLTLPDSKSERIGGARSP